MAVYATFVGVNTCLDLRIPELTGATRDATALWALFSDSIPDIKANLLLNTDATAAAIKTSFSQHLSEAGSDDTLLFFFAGHGSPDHHLVTYDTDRDNISESAIPMADLALLLAGSQARTVILLDCCFSGGATSRVLQGVPVSRKAFSTVVDLQGKGRVIFTASQKDQPALEINGHGLFTKAILDTFMASTEGLNLGEFIDSVTQRVRAEAERLGADQRSVAFNHIEDGLTFPVLCVGKIYATHFPDITGVKVSKNIQDLTAFGLPIDLVNAWSQQFPNGLNDLQLSAINEYRVLEGRSLLTVAPTSAGKTFIGELAISKAIAYGRKAVFLLPYRALTNEKFEDFSALYAEQLGYRVIRCTGDYSDNINDFICGRYDIALFTYEMFLNLTLSVPSTMYKIGLVVIDEAQFITDETRGIHVELLLTNLLIHRKRGISPQLVALSAVIGDINYFNEWLNCGLLVTHQRPIPLIEGVLDRSGTFQYMDADGTEKIESWLSPSLIRQRGNKTGLQDVIVPLTQKLIAEDETVIVFRNKRGSTLGCANYLAGALNLPAAQIAINALSNSDPSRSTEKLISALQGGTCFHNADLTRNERRVVENAFRLREGGVKVMCATTTVAAGVNTPASTVIIAETFFYDDSGHKDFSVAEYKNMAGRAGRLGISECGRSVILAETPNERNLLYKKYVKGIPEPLHSSFNITNLNTWILRLLSQVKEIPQADTIHLLTNTFGGYIANRLQPSWLQKTTEHLSTLLKQMITLGLVEEYDTKIKLTLLGGACGRSNLSFPSVINLVEQLKKMGTKLDAFGLMGLIQILPEVAGYTPILKKGTKESVWSREVSVAYGKEITQVLQSRAKDQFEYYARCKRAAIINRWIQGMPIEQIERDYSVTPYQGNIGAGDVRGFADTTRFCLRAASEIADLILLGEGPEGGAIDQLLKRLEIGLPESALPLLELPVSLLRGEYLALHKSGYYSPESVLALNEDELCQLVASTTAINIRKTVHSKQETSNA